jgi:TonB family protein
VRVGLSVAVWVFVVAGGGGLRATAQSLDRPSEAERQAAILPFYPPKARAAGVEGDATLMCERTDTAALVNCRIGDEHPTDQGFGPAALEIARQAKGLPGLTAAAGAAPPILFTFRLNPPSITPNLLALPHVILNPDWLTKPSPEAMADAYPHEAALRRITGSATLDCVVDASGAVSDCTAKDDPPGMGFADAALQVAKTFAFKPRTLDGLPIGGAKVVAPLRFSAPAQEQAQGPQITNPDWLKKPSGEDMENFYPAASGGAAGKAFISCIVTSRGTLDKCFVVSESPTGMGFGAAALSLAPMFMMRPMTENGVPVGGAHIVIPINFAGGPGFFNSSDSIQIVSNLPWGKTPTAADMAAVFPLKSVGQVARAHVVLRCRITRDGPVKSCQTVTEQPVGRGFANAARDLIKAFQVVDDPGVRGQLKDAFVDIPFDFRDPSKPSPPPELIDPQWIRGPDPQMAGQLFPPEAAKAGFKSGLGVIDCEVSHDGALTGCSVVREDPAGMGFGKLALAIADIMTMNPWSKQGIPVDGGRVRVPIRLNLNPDTPSPPARPAAPK